MGLWKEKLAATNQKAAQSLADPAEYENLFPGLQEAVRAEELLRREREQLPPASTYPSVTVSNAHTIYYTLPHTLTKLTHTHTHTHTHTQSPCDRNILEELRSGQLDTAPPTSSKATPTQQETTPPAAADVEEEDFDLDDEEELNLDDLDLNADVSVWNQDTQYSL